MKIAHETIYFHFLHDTIIDIALIFFEKKLGISNCWNLYALIKGGEKFYA
jgi:hypothetical protein